MIEFFNSLTAIDLVGYGASIALIISFTMKNVTKLRSINSIGAILFVVYGFMFDITAWPIIITNVFILALNLYYLFIKKSK
ncbi:MAG: uroporphyrinogen decarboxylase [Flavobacteriaceae bacterium]|nr:uroporphyrinogen decarboxylase [Flavobacteriaceae bacterium]